MLSTLLQRSTRIQQRSLATEARVAVVGGGLSGSLCALSLAARGVPCCVYDQGASGGRFGGSAQRDAGRTATGATLARGGWSGDFSFCAHRGELRLGAGALSRGVVHGFEGDFGGHALARDFDLVG